MENETLVFQKAANTVTPRRVSQKQSNRSAKQQQTTTESFDVQKALYRYDESVDRTLRYELVKLVRLVLGHCLVLVGECGTDLIDNG